MKVIKKFGIIFHPNFKLLSKKFLAITLFGHVFMNKSYDELEEFLNTPRGRKLANHEYIHILQAKTFKTGYFGFYIYYIWYWIKNLFKYGLNIKAYRNIPFELEAKTNEADFEYINIDWKKYIK